MKPLALLMLIISVYCVDVSMDTDRCFSTVEAAAYSCDERPSACRGIYEVTRGEQQ